MPSRNRKPKKKKKKPQKPQEIEYKLNFSDITVIEANEEFDKVEKLIEEQDNQTSWSGRFKPHFSKLANPVGAKDWNISTNLTIESPFGIGQMELNLRADKSVYITDYTPSTGNTYYNPDLSALMRWSQIKGWNVPKPIASLVQSNLTFWRYMWETLIIDSDYLDERYGIRKSLDMRDAPKTEMELAEEREMEGL